MTNPEPWAAARDSRIDWPKVLEDIAYLLGTPRNDNPLLRDSVSQERLAAALGYPRGTLRNWLDGTEPRHGDGEILIEFWTRLTGKARTFIPVDRYVHSAGRTVQTAIKPIQTRPKAFGGLEHARCAT